MLYREHASSDTHESRLVSSARFLAAFSLLLLTARLGVYVLDMTSGVLT